MRFGYSMAPAHFSYVVHSLLNAVPLEHCPNHGTYVDDVHIAGHGLANTWNGTIEAIRRLTRGGFLLNAWKL